jgi:energy-coupling factor transport system ATP-binding protein
VTTLARIEDLSYWYPGAVSPALRSVDLELDAGLSLVVGESGGGKSTLLRLLNGLVPQFHGGRISGSATVAGLDTLRTPIPRIAARVGLVFQDVETQSVYGTVEREVAFGLENAAMSRAEMHERVGAVLEELSIGHLRSRRLATLSGGERQRVQLAAVLGLRPQVVALDEPTSQLDARGAEAVLAACCRLARDGRAVVVAEHRLESLLPAADRVLRVEAGRVGDAGTLEMGGRRPEALRSAGREGRLRGADLAWELRDVAAGPAGSAGPAILEGVSLAGAAGEVMALVGPNGSGKTTLLRTLAGLTPALSGTVRRPQGRTAYLPQNPGALLYLPTLRAEVEVTLRRTRENGAGRHRGRGTVTATRAATAETVATAATVPAATRAAAEAMLAAFGLASLADRYPRDLSSGERQRAALAATLAGEPALVLLDEPTRGMDLAARRALVAAIRALTERGSAVVVATHDTDLAAEIADSIVAVGDGGATRLDGLATGVSAAPNASRHSMASASPNSAASTAQPAIASAAR